MVKSQIKNKYTLCPAIKALYLFSAVVTMALAVLTPWFRYSCEVFKYEAYTISKGPIYIFNEVLGFEGPLTLFSMDGSIDPLAFVGPLLMIVAVVCLCVSVGLMCASRTASALILNLIGVVTTVASIITTGVVEYSVMDANLSRFSFVLDDIDFVYDKFLFYPGLAIDYLGFALALVVLIGIAVWAYLSNTREQKKVKVCVTKFTFGEVLPIAMQTWAYKLPILFGLCAIVCLILTASVLGLLLTISLMFALLIPVSVLLNLGLKKVSLKAVRGEDVSAQTLFSVWNKEHIAKYLGGCLWYGLFVSLWFMIPIAGLVFGVIKAYEYRFTPYILVEHDDVSATEALKLSKKMTYGNKAKMFAIDMATIGVLVGLLVVFGLLTVVPFLGTIGTIYFAVAALMILVFAKTYFGCIVAQEYHLANMKYEEPDQD